MLLSAAVKPRYRHHGRRRRIAAGAILALIVIAAAVGMVRSGSPFTDHRPSPALCELREASERTPNCP
jgi:hypothetical protein